MLNFTVGPVQSSDIVRKIGGENVPYFRTPEFSAIMLENEKLIKKFAKSREESKVVFMTMSGTGSMESVVTNCFTQNDKLIVINGGSFGKRFTEICDIHHLTYSEIRLDYGQDLKSNDLQIFDNKGYTGLLVNVHETSTGVHYDIKLIADFCRRNNIFLVVDAISSFLADELNFSELNIGAMITGSQKALACPPGISVIVLSPNAIKRIEQNQVACMYLDLKRALKDAERGQTPFTPAVGILLQINARLKEIDSQGGVESEIQKISEQATDFRQKIQGLPFEIVPKTMSNAVTTLHPLTASAYDIFTTLKDQYNIWVCPNGGELSDKIFRVGHIGYLNHDDNTTLVNALKDMQKKGLI